MNKDERHAFNQRNIADFLASGGRITSFGDAPVLLLTPIGAKSGERRINPLMYLADDHAPDRVYVFASAAGADKNPDWLHNLLAHPKDLTVEIGKETLAALRSCPIWRADRSSLRRPVSIQASLVTKRRRRGRSRSSSSTCTANARRSAS